MTASECQIQSPSRPRGDGEPEDDSTNRQRQRYRPEASQCTEEETRRKYPELENRISEIFKRKNNFIISHLAITNLAPTKTGPLHYLGP